MCWCQELCPANIPLPEMKVHTLELDEAETQALISSDTAMMTPELKQKLSEFGIDDGSISAAGRNAKLALMNLLLVDAC